MRGLGQRLDRRDGPFGQLACVEAAQLQLDRAGPKSGQVKDVAHETLHAQRVAIDGGQQGGALVIVRRVFGVKQQAHAGAHGGQGCAQLMSDGREQVRPELLQLGESLHLVSLTDEAVLQPALADAGGHVPLT